MSFVSQFIRFPPSSEQINGLPPSSLKFFFKSFLLLLRFRLDSPGILSESRSHPDYGVPLAHTQDPHSIIISSPYNAHDVTYFQFSFENSPKHA